MRSTHMSIAWSDGTGKSDFSDLLGKRVWVCGLKAKPEYNGQAGRVYSFDHQKGRAGVHLDSGPGLWVLPANLIEEGAEAAPQAEQPVPDIAPSFIASPFSTRAEFDAWCKLPADARAEAERAAEEKRHRAALPPLVQVLLALTHEPIVDAGSFRQLVDAFAIDVNARYDLESGGPSADGNTLLAFVCSADVPDPLAAARLLLALGADPEVANGEGETPLTLAIEGAGESSELVALLRRHATAKGALDEAEALDRAERRAYARGVQPALGDRAGTETRAAGGGGGSQNTEAAQTGGGDSVESPQAEGGAPAARGGRRLPSEAWPDQRALFPGESEDDYYFVGGHEIDDDCL